MDSLSQIVLGAAVAGALMPTRRALIYGAVLGTLPDLDVLVRFADPVDRLTLHRTASHSLIVLSLAAPLLFGLARRFDVALREDSSRWRLIFWLALITHPLLDVMTIYGTQLLWPIDRTPFGVGCVFIVDPAYTLPLLLASWWAWRQRGARRACQLALFVSTAYLAFGVYLQQRVLLWATDDLRQTGTATGQTKLLVTTAPLTNLMHRVIAREPNGYREAYVSIFFDRGPIQWQPHGSADEWLPSLRTQTSFQRLEQFSHGFFALEAQQVDRQTHLIYSDLRMGDSQAYVFRYDLGPPAAPFDPVVKLPSQRPSVERIKWLTRRFFGQQKL